MNTEKVVCLELEKSLEIYRDFPQFFSKEVLAYEKKWGLPTSRFIKVLITQG